MPAELRKKEQKQSLSTSIVRAGQSMTDGQPKEFFWGCTLTKGDNSVTWSTEDEEEDEDFLKHTLYLRHAMLGTGAAADERHVVEIETKDHQGELLKQPIFSLKMNFTEMVPLDLNFPNDIPVTLRLVEGAGPVHISGQQLLEFPDDDEDEFDTEAATEDEDVDLEDEEEAEEEEDEEVESNSQEEEEEEGTDSSRKSGSKATKRKASLTGSKHKNKKGRRETSASENGTDEEEEEDEEEADESMDAEDDEDYEDEEEKKKSSKKAKAKGKGERVVKKAKDKAVGKKGKKVKA